MSDQSNPNALPAEGQVSRPSNRPSETVTCRGSAAQAAPTSSRRFVRDPVGDPLQGSAGQSRSCRSSAGEARMGDIIELSPYEFATTLCTRMWLSCRSRAPVLSLTRPELDRRLPTPFGVPVKIDDPTDPDHGEVAGFPRADHGRTPPRRARVSSDQRTGRRRVFHSRRRRPSQSSLVCRRDGAD
jgi:hypothetical protein